MLLFEIVKKKILNSTRDQHIQVLPTFGYLSTGTSSLMTLFTTGADGIPGGRCQPREEA